MTLLELGGPALWAILFVGLCAAALFLERLFHLHRATLRGDGFVEGILRVLGQGNTFEAATLCEEAPGPVAHLVKTAVLHAGDDLAVLRQALEEAGLQEIPRLQRGLPLLSVFAQILPLLGLLGTVAGLMRLLYRLQSAAEPPVFAPEFTGGLWEALITTAAGLGVAIPVYVAVHYLHGRVEALILDMEQVAAEILGFMARRPLPPAERPRP